MPLPSGNVEWPPPHVRPALKTYTRFGAWWAGDIDALAEVYGASAYGHGGDLKDYAVGRGGALTRVSRFFHGTQASPGQVRTPKLHMPLAGDIAATSADLLFGEPPAFVVDDEKGKGTETQARLDEYLEEGIHAALLEAAEIAAAYGGVYLRVGWDTAIAEMPLWDVIPPDAAVPEWRSGRLTAVTFWRVLHEESGQVWRHLERHEPGRILHGLYQGTDDKLGRVVPLKDRPETEAFGSLVNAESAIETGATGLCAEYIPNMRPNRKLRGSPLGRSDYDGIEPALDALDETWTSWMRDLRLGKARLVVPRQYLQSEGRGQGASFDPDRELYEAIESLPGTGGLEISHVQFAIRVVEHRETAAAIRGEALRGAGYSAQTFGDQGDTAATATEVVARERRSYTTRGRKINYWRPSLARLAFTALEIDVAKFRPDGVTPERPTLEWPDGVAVDPEAQGRTLQLLQSAEAASIRTRVEMLHPDWDEDRVVEEVDLIRSETGNAPVPNPDGFTGVGGAPQPAEGDPADPMAPEDPTDPAKPAQPGVPAQRTPGQPAQAAAGGRAARQADFDWGLFG